MDTTQTPRTTRTVESDPAPSAATASPASATVRRQRRAAAVIGATGAALLVWLLAVPVLGVDLVTTIGEGGADVPVGIVAVGFAAVVAGLAAWGLLALLEVITRHARTIWITVALVVLAFSLSGPLTWGATLGAQLTLAAMHLAVGAVLVPALGRTSR